MMDAIRNALRAIDETFSRRHALASMRALKQVEQSGERGLFVDCGGYDGCSAVKFILANPSWDCITFEPNPEMWPYYDRVPTALVTSGVAAEEGSYEFFVDHVDGDGSTIVPEKTVVFGGGAENANVESRSIHCVDLTNLINGFSERYDKLILKLDVEGAEYDILEKMVKNGTLQKIDAIMCEWHWKKCGIPKARHDALVSAIKLHCSVSEWDALDFGVHTRSSSFRKWRERLVAEVLGDLERYRSVSSAQALFE